VYFSVAFSPQHVEVADQPSRPDEGPARLTSASVRSDSRVGKGCVVNTPFIAGTISTIIFATSLLPMLIKARRTRDMASYSLGNILLSNLGNLVHSVYVLSLPAGPLWALHGFYLVSMGLLLVWYIRFRGSAGAALARQTYTRAMAHRSA
jgi:uncharacterized protein with PQ loop repeat